MTSSVSSCTEGVGAPATVRRPASAAGRRRSLPSARTPGTASDASTRRRGSLSAQVRRRPVTGGVGVSVGVRAQEGPSRITSRWPLSCGNVVGDTGIEPVTSSVSVLRTAFTAVRSSASVQVRRVHGPGRMAADWAGPDAVGVCVGVRPLAGSARAVEPPDSRRACPPARSLANENDPRTRLCAREWPAAAARVRSVCLAVS